MVYWTQNRGKDGYSDEKSENRAENRGGAGAGVHGGVRVSAPQGDLVRRQGRAARRMPVLAAEKVVQKEESVDRR